MIAKEWINYAPEPPPLPPGKEWHIFLSYRSVNRPWVLSLYDILTEMGYKVFLDQYVLKPGDELIRTLEMALDKSQAGVLVWSFAASDSDWVYKEYQTMETKSTHHRDFNYVIAKIDPSTLPTFAANKIYTDFSHYPEGPNGGELLRLLHGVNGKPLDDSSVRFAAEQNEASANAMAQVESAIQQGRTQKLIDLFEQGGLAWETSAALSCKAANGLIKLGANDEAIEMLEQVEKTYPKSIRPKQLKALAYARRFGKQGDVADLDTAQDILGLLYNLNNLDPETMGIYARTWMDRYTLSQDLRDLKESRRLYAEAFERSPDDYYTGINAAAKSVFIGTEKDLERAADYAAQVLQITGNEVVKDDYWKTATIGEALLIQGHFKEAADIYEAAVEIAGRQDGNIDSTKTQAQRLLEKLNPTDEEKKLVLAAFE
jgi:tetratricopeptide (TPR) repeat protein